MRVTNTTLRNYVGRINNLLKENGVCIEYGLNIAYGGYMLVKYDGKGERARTYRHTARELYYALNAIENVLIDLYY